MQQERDGLTAAAGPPLIPPRPWFEMEEPDEPTGWTVTADGQVFGHAAIYGTCHTGKPGRCVTPPKSASDYAYYKTGLTEVDDGELIPTGRITLGTGHASLTASPAATAEHYDNTGSVVADVNIRDGKHGIWVSGALRPNVTPERIRELRGASLSGDWRNIRGGLEMLGLLAVNVPGFPVPQAMAASGEEDEVLALVAAGTFERQELYRETLAATEPSDADWEGAIEELTAAADKSARHMGQRAKVTEVMREFKAGKLKSSSGSKVTSRKQAIAIALSQARMTASAEELAELAVTAAGFFDESKHPRKPKGSKGGGQWTVKELRQGLESGELSSQDVLDIVSPAQDPSVAQPPEQYHYKGREITSNTLDGERYYRVRHSGGQLATTKKFPSRKAAEDYVDSQAGMVVDESSTPPATMMQDAARRQRAARASRDVLRRGGTEGQAREAYQDERDYAPLTPLPKPAKGKPIKNRRSSEPFMASVLTADSYEAGKQELLDDGWQIRDEGDGWCLLEDPDTGNVQLVSEEVGELTPDQDEDELIGSDEEELYAAGSFDEAKHPRHKKGEKDGGKFAPKGAGESAQPEQTPKQAKTASERSRAYYDHFDENGKPIGAWADLPENEELDAATRQSGSSKYVKKTFGELPVGAVYRDVHGGLELKMGQTSATNKRRTPMHVPENYAVYVPRSMRADGAPEPCEECGEPVDPMSLPAARSVEVRTPEGGAILAASFTQQQRDKLAEKGEAMSDGSFPIRNRSDLRNAIQELGRASDPEAARAHIIKRARKLKAVSALPASWNITASGEEEVVAAGTFDETLHPRHPAGDKQGGEFAPKGTGKMITGPSGKLMSKTEAGVLQDKAEGRYVKSHSETPPTAPGELRRMDPGVSHYASFENGDEAWLVTTKPPSGIERDTVYVQEAGGKLRKATDADFERPRADASHTEGKSIATPMKLASPPKQKVTARLVKSVADKLHNGVEPTAIMHFDRIPPEQWSDVYDKARKQLIKDGRMRIETDKYDV